MRLPRRLLAVEVLHDLDTVAPPRARGVGVCHAPRHAIWRPHATRRGNVRWCAPRYAQVRTTLRGFAYARTHLRTPIQRISGGIMVGPRVAMMLAMVPTIAALAPTPCQCRNGSCMICDDNGMVPGRVRLVG